METMFKTIIFLTSLALVLCSCSDDKNLLEIESDEFGISLNRKGNITSLTDLNSKENFVPEGIQASLISVKTAGGILTPRFAKVSNDIIVMEFNDTIALEVKYVEKSTHITFEVVGATGMEEIEMVIWGPIPTTISKIIGETIGVVRGDTYALGIQALNPKTLGGFPWLDNDTTPQLDIFEQDDYSDLNEEGKRMTLYRVDAAKPEAFGSTLQAYTRNRLKERVISNLSHDFYVSPVYQDGGIIGSKIALFGCNVTEALGRIGEIEIQEGLPHPELNGVWTKLAKEASSAYLIYDFSEETIEEAIAFTQKAGLKYLYHSDPFKNWGHFDLKEEYFPRGWDGLKTCVEKAAKAGITVGVHTLSNFITTNDPFVTPVPDPGLGKVGSSILTSSIDNNQTEIPIASPKYFDQFQNNSLQTVQIGEELIRYGSVSKTEPWRLLDCQRGYWGTMSNDHEKGTDIHKLADHAYKVFLSDPELSKEIAKNLASLYNHTGLKQISFDGLEGNRSTGMGNYGEILFTNTWWENLNPANRLDLIIDASRTTHYFWHLYSRMNWGEPWYAGFRESQTEYRLKNQEYFQRNMMPAMLGWFSLRNNTPIEDIEWMLARSAAFNAGYAFVVKDEALEKNGQLEAIFQNISDWEKIRMAGILTDSQKTRMKDINNEFHLERTGHEAWNLFQVHVSRFEHVSKELQPGEPLYTSHNWDNPVESGGFGFIITAEETEISNITFELNNSRVIELAVRLKDGESIRYQGGNLAQVYDAGLRPKGEVKIEKSDFRLKEGQQKINFNCEFHYKNEKAKAKIEIRVYDKAEPLKIEGTTLSD